MERKKSIYLDSIEEEAESDMEKTLTQRGDQGGLNNNAVGIAICASFNIGKLRT